MNLTRGQRDLLASARRATLATIDPRGRARLVPICFVMDEDAGPVVVLSPLDEKPKAGSDPLDLARVRDIAARPEVTVLVDRWSEDWSELAWLRLAGRATIVPVADPATIAALRAKHPQYASHDLEHRPMIRIEIESLTSWGLAED